MCKNVVDYDNNNCYGSKDYLKESFICFDFKNKKIQLSDYSIMSSSSRYDGFLKNWIIEVSNDGENFIEIDRRSDNSQLNGFKKFATFTVQKKSKEFKMDEQNLFYKQNNFVRQPFFLIVNHLLP